MVTVPAVTAVPPAPTTILSLSMRVLGRGAGAPSSKPRVAPSASVRAPVAFPRVKTSAVELTN